MQLKKHCKMMQPKIPLTEAQTGKEIPPLNAIT